MRHRTRPSPPAVDDQFLDEDEQSRMIEELERAEARQVRLAKTFTGVLGGTLVSLLLYFAVDQAINPWRARHHAELEGLLSKASVVMGEGGSAVALLASTTALLVYRPDTGARPEEAWRSLLAFSSTAALFACGFWATALYKVLHRNQFDLASTWRLLWLPLVPGVYVVSMAVLVNSLVALQPGLAKLRAQRYRLKRA